MCRGPGVVENASLNALKGNRAWNFNAATRRGAAHPAIITPPT